MIRILKQIKRSLATNLLPNSPDNHPITLLSDQKQALEHDSVLTKYDRFEDDSSNEDSESPFHTSRKFQENSLLMLFLGDNSPIISFKHTSPISIINRRRTASVPDNPPSVSFAEELEDKLKSPRKYVPFIVTV